jgi:hypothetical protein
MEEQVYKTEEDVFRSLSTNGAVITTLYQDKYTCSDIFSFASQNAIEAIIGRYEIACKLNPGSGKKVLVFVKTDKEYYQQLAKCIGRKNMVYRGNKSFNSEAELKRSMINHEIVVVGLIGDNGNGTYQTLCCPQSLMSGKDVITTIKEEYSKYNRLYPGGRVSVVAGNAVSVSYCMTGDIVMLNTSMR